MVQMEFGRVFEGVFSDNAARSRCLDTLNTEVEVEFED